MFHSPVSIIPVDIDHNPTPKPLLYLSSPPPSLPPKFQYPNGASSAARPSGLPRPPLPSPRPNGKPTAAESTKDIDAERKAHTALNGRSSPQKGATLKGEEEERTQANGFHSSGVSSVRTDTGHTTDESRDPSTTLCPPAPHSSSVSGASAAPPPPLVNRPHVPAFSPMSRPDSLSLSHGYTQSSPSLWNASTPSPASTPPVKGSPGSLPPAQPPVLTPGYICHPSYQPHPPRPWIPQHSFTPSPQPITQREFRHPFPGVSPPLMFSPARPLPPLKGGAAVSPSHHPPHLAAPVHSPDVTSDSPEPPPDASAKPRARRKRCGMCAGCLCSQDCGQCSPCRNPKSNQCCVKRKCESLKAQSKKNGVTKRLITELSTPTEDPILPEEQCPLAEPPAVPPQALGEVQRKRRAASTPVKATTSPLCSCSAVGQQGPFYTQLGGAPTAEKLRDLLERRCNAKGHELRMVEISYTGVEAKSETGCPTAQWVLRRLNKEEKFLVLFKRNIGHSCEHTYTIVSLVVWDAFPKVQVDGLYHTLTDILPKNGAPTARKCCTNESKTCSCQGTDPETCGASYSFGCSWAVYYNGCKFARSKEPRKFRISNSAPDKEKVLGDTLNDMAALLAPMYKQLAPVAYDNQITLQKEGTECRIGYGEERPFSGVTCCMDFSAHSHHDRHNMMKGSTILCTILKAGVMGTEDRPDDEQLHVLPLYRPMHAPSESIPGLEVRKQFKATHFEIHGNSPEDNQTLSGDDFQQVAAQANENGFPLPLAARQMLETANLSNSVDTGSDTVDSASLGSRPVGGLVTPKEEPRDPAVGTMDSSTGLMGTPPKYSNGMNPADRSSASLSSLLRNTSTDSGIDVSTPDPGTPLAKGTVQQWDPSQTPLSTNMRASPSSTTQTDAEQETPPKKVKLIQPVPGGVAIALSHGCVLVEAAKMELHATTPLKWPNRHSPTRISLVFYQHKNLHRRQHGYYEEVQKMAERKEERRKLHAILADMIDGAEEEEEDAMDYIGDPLLTEEFYKAMRLSLRDGLLQDSDMDDDEYEYGYDPMDIAYLLHDSPEDGVLRGRVPTAVELGKNTHEFVLEVPIEKSDSETHRLKPYHTGGQSPCPVLSTSTACKSTLTTSFCHPQDIISGHYTNWRK